MYIVPAGFQRTRSLGSYLRNLPMPRRTRSMGRLRGLRRLGDSGYSDPTTGEWIDTSGQAAEGAVGPGIQPLPYSQPGDLFSTDPITGLPLAPVATAGPQMTNYSPAAVVPNPLSYATPALAIAAGIPAAQVNAAFAAQPQTGIPSMWLWIAGGIAAVVFLGSAGGGSGRRR